MTSDQQWHLLICRVLRCDDAVVSRSDETATDIEGAARFTDHVNDASWLLQMLEHDAGPIGKSGEDFSVLQTVRASDSAGFTVVVGHCSTPLSPAVPVNRQRIRTQFASVLSTAFRGLDSPPLWDHIAALVPPEPSLQMQKDLDQLSTELAPETYPLGPGGLSVEVASGGSFLRLSEPVASSHALISDIAAGLAFAQLVAARQDRLVTQAMNVRRAIGGLGTRAVRVRGTTILATGDSLSLPRRTTDRWGLGLRDLAASLEWLAIESGDTKNLQHTLSTGLQGPRVRVFRAYLAAWDSPAELVSTQTVELGQQVVLRHSSDQQNKLTSTLNLIATALATLAVVGLAVDLTWLAGSDLVTPERGPAADGSGLLDIVSLASPNAVISLAAAAALVVVVLISVAMRRWQS